MAARALIIAIENYPQAEAGVARTLPGTLQAGLDFRAWLEDKWRSEGRKASDTQIIFCSEPPQAGHTGADRVDIVKALFQLKQDGRNMTEELYVFFSGHGFAFVDSGRRADMIISADFVNADISGDSCHNLDQIISWLRGHMGPGQHFYFVDACRNSLSGNQISQGADLRWDPQAAPEASTFALQSTAAGAAAAAQSAFPALLLAGLRGKGRAKVWEAGLKDAMVVKYESLRLFLKSSATRDQKITSNVEGEVGEGEAVLATLRPIPHCTCTIEIVGAAPTDSGSVLIKRGRATVGETTRFTETPPAIPLEPDSYSVSVSLNGGTVTPDTAVTVDLFDDQVLRFTKGAPKVDGGGPSPPSIPPSGPDGTTAELTVIVPPDAELSLRRVETGSVDVLKTSATLRRPAGGYIAILRGKDNLVKRKEVDVVIGEAVSLDLADWQNSVPHRSIAALLPQYGGSPDFSESLGGVITDPDLGLWLALVGGGRLLGSQGDYSKLAHFPLHDFSGEVPGASPIYVLAGFEDPTTVLQVSAARPRQRWQPATQPNSMPGIREAYFAVEPGPQLVSFRIANDPSYTIASAASPNRGTLVTVTLDEQKQFVVSQYLLPLGHLASELPTEVRQRIQSRNHLSDVRFLAKASRAFRKRRNLEREFQGSELLELLYAKWLDPIGSAIASYELIRRGKEPRLIADVVDNMLRFFPDLPDALALARLTGRSVDRPKGPPLFFDGLRAFPDYPDWLPLPATHLDFNSSWTAWRAAVETDLPALNAHRAPKRGQTLDTRSQS